MLSNISDLFTMASLVICMLLSGIIFYYLRTRISMLEQSVMDQAQLLQQVVTSLKSSQYRQQMNANANTTNANMISAQQQDVVNSNQGQMNLIQVSDDSDDSDDSESSDSSDDSESDNDENGVNVCTLEGSCSKIIDLSTIASYANYSKPFPQTEIKVIELKSNIRSDKDYLGNSSDDDGDDASSDDDGDDASSDEDEDDGDDEDGDQDGDEDEDKDMNGEKNNTRNENDIESKNDESENQSHVNVNIKKIKSIVIEDPTTYVSLDEMKNMPVNSLRSLAKTKLGNIIDVPTINKMSKKDILKALHEE